MLRKEMKRCIGGWFSIGFNVSIKRWVQATAKSLMVPWAGPAWAYAAPRQEWAMAATNPPLVGSARHCARSDAFEPSDGGGVPHVDTQTLESLRMLQLPDEESPFEKFVQLYVTRAPQLIQQLHDALAGDDMEAFFRAAHNLKSNSATVGASRMAETAKDLEQMARRGRLESPERLLAALAAEYPHVKSLLEAEACQDPG